MKNTKKLIKLAGALILSAPLCAGDFRTPLNLMHSQVMRLKPAKNAWWAELMPSQKSEVCCWNIEKWTSLYTRSAGKAFQSSDNESNKVTTNTKSLATLFYGKDRFKASEAFSNGKITDVAQLNKFTPLLNVAYLTPEYRYDEKGICIGMHVNYTFEEDCNWHVGGVINVPVSVVEVTPQGEIFEEQLENLYKINTIKAQNSSTSPNTSVNYTNDLTIRYDLLNTLMLDEQTKLLRQDGPNTKIGFISIDGDTNLTSGQQAYLIKRSNTQSPEAQYRKQASQVTGQITPNGLGAADDSVLFVATGTNLSTLNTDSNAQAELWLVPRATDSNTDELTSLSQAMVSQIDYAVRLADLSNRSVTNFLTKQGLALANYERKAGLGDIKAAIYGCYNDQECDWFVKLMGGTKLPTGTKKDHDECLSITQLQTGNNRHWELFVQMAAGYQPLEWLSFDMTASANHVFARSQNFVAAFEGATVKNLGPCVKAKVSWNYFTAQANMNLFHPHNPELGCTLGYSLFAKNSDHVRYDNVDATDLFGNTHKVLDPDVAALKTKAMTHSVRAEVFHRWNYCEISAGGSYGIAGRNAMKETEAHIGLSVYF
ncbi:hypothetical protein EKK58_03705 [Candidatus Dependentiae bacterium]|nr:MAG: hypothetical protein EKK58_03705 [Candidatus Dependentiae bacterium]